MKALLFAWLCVASASCHAQARSWLFEVRLDGQPVGEHRFDLAPEGEGLRLRSEAQFTVRVLGIPLYRYRHSADERWRDGCLQSLDASTDDNGKAGKVTHRIKDGDCLMTFAYWNPALLRQTRLLNPQTGVVEPARIERVGPGTFDAAAGPLEAVRWRIHTREQPIDLWLSGAGEWIGLESTVAGGRRLAYRLRP